MKSANVKFSTSTKEVQEVEQTERKKKSIKQRIDEEGLFNLFTADIMKLKKKFVR